MAPAVKIGSVLAEGNEMPAEINHRSGFVVPAGYDPHSYPPFAVTVDLVIFTILDKQLCVLTVTRGFDPFQGFLALPGGFVGIDEDAETAARRELVEETHVSGDFYLEQLGTWSAPDRDPRMRVVSVAHMAVIPKPEGIQVLAGDDAAGAGWVSVDEFLDSDVAFDHQEIVRAGLERLRSKLEYTDLVKEFLPPDFTIGDLRAVYEIIWNADLPFQNFKRKIMPMLESSGSDRRPIFGERRSPAYHWRNDAEGLTQIFPPFSRSEF
jgi:8-oxo-dGTP diphosphatase